MEIIIIFGYLDSVVRGHPIVDSLNVTAVFQGRKSQQVRKPGQRPQDLFEEQQDVSLGK